MTTRPLPVVQSIPHGGLGVPGEVADRLVIDDVTIYNECDLGADQIFDFDRAALAHRTSTLGTVTFPVARVLIDANRPPDSLDDPDGAVKTQTSYGDPIYRTPIGREMQIDLRERYWQPFHRQLDELLRREAGNVRLFLDCHNMAQRGPTAYGDPGQVRPLICIANNGDADGEARSERNDTFGRLSTSLTAPPGLARLAAEIATDLFADLDLLDPNPDPTPIVTLNHPFAGGYILRHYTSSAYQQSLGLVESERYVGLMVEVNRGLFVGNQHTDTPIRPPNEERIAAVRRRLYRWALALLDAIEAGDGK